MKQRPFGVKLFGIWFVVFGSLGAIGATGYALVASGVDHFYGVERTVLRNLQISRSIVVSLLWLACGVGLFMMKRWARRLAFIAAILSSANVILTKSSDGTLSWPESVVVLGWSGLVIWYFLRPGVKAQFQKRSIE